MTRPAPRRPRRSLLHALAVLGLLDLHGQAASAGEPPWSERLLAVPLAPDALDGLSPEDRRARLVARGEKLFTGKFVTADGAGRPGATQAIVPTKRRRPAALTFQRLAGLDANACASCHNEPVAGGAGAFTANVFVSEGFESADFDTIDPQFSNERGTNALQGAGLVELLAREMTADLQATRDAALREARAQGDAVRRALVAKGVGFGEITAHPDGSLDISRIEGIDADLVLRPFSQKGVFGSLRQFTVNALNQHHGIQAVERFGSRWTGTDDFDGDGVANEIAATDISALVAWQATLPPPTRRRDLPDGWRETARRGEILFAETGCATCHVPALPLRSTVFQDPAPFETAGTLRAADVETPITIDLGDLDVVRVLPRDATGAVLVPLYGDLKRHRIADARAPELGNELLGQRFVDRDVFLTAELWGIGSTAPYGHRGDLTTLREVIEAHGGEASDARAAWLARDEADRQAIIAFLRSLEIAR